MNKINITKLLQINREKLCNNFFLIGILIAYFGSLNPWFMWPIMNFYMLFAAFFVVFHLILSDGGMKRFPFPSNYVFTLLFYSILVFYQSIVREANINGFISNMFSVLVMYAILVQNNEKMTMICTTISKIMGCILSASIVGFVLFFLGFPLPSVNAQFMEGEYSYTNYFLFLLDDRTFEYIIPRFHSIFVEPGQIGTALVVLLMTQFGKWKKWYNIVTIVSILLTFSLAAYVYFVLAIFMNLWVCRKAILKKGLLALLVLGVIVGASFVYKGGDNMVHDLIILRLEIDDGEMAGDNRVTDEFLSEYESLLGSSDVIFGRGLWTEWGSSGYRVFIYENGLFGTILLLLMYFFAFINARDKRRFVCAWVMAFWVFVVRAYMLWYSIFFPLFTSVNQNNKLSKKSV